MNKSNLIKKVDEFIKRGLKIAIWIENKQDEICYKEAPIYGTANGKKGKDNLSILIPGTKCDDEDNNFPMEIHRVFVLWRFEIIDFTRKKDFPKQIEKSYMEEPDSVPNTVSGPYYSDIKSILSQTLMDNIKTEAKNKLNFLRWVKEKLNGFKEKLITRDNEGNFYFNGKIVEFRGKNTIYYFIFECLFENHDTSGFCSYECIENYLAEHGKGFATNPSGRNARIRNRTYDLFKYSNIKRYAPDGIEIIKIEKNVGLVLYNPSI